MSLGIRFARCSTHAIDAGGAGLPGSSRAEPDTAAIQSSVLERAEQIVAPPGGQYAVTAFAIASSRQKAPSEQVATADAPCLFEFA